MLFDYQQENKIAVYGAWNDGARNIIDVIPAGGGKTTIFCEIVRELNAPACIIAHRQELVSQASLALNREQVPHGIIAPSATIRQIVALHMETHGKTFYSARAPARVAGVDTLVARGGDKDRWFKQVQLVVQDEGHHVIASNKWGKAMGLFPSARGLFPTAHAVRADGLGLGRATPERPNADGLADVMVVGPSPRDLINRGFLCDYRLVCPPSDIILTDADVGPSGDYTGPKLRAAVHKSKQIVGDVVKFYLQFAEGALGLSFAVDLDAAKEIATAYRRAGVPAEIITGETPIPVRAALMRKFRNREILQLVSVDVLGEGTDVPAVEVVSMARPTASFQLFGQTFWRGGRISVGRELMQRWPSFTDDERKTYIAASSKPKFMVIDHVGNIAKHAPLPDVPRSYSLERRERRSRQGQFDAIPLRTCLNPTCLQPFERVLLKCPYCFTIPIPAGRSAPELVDGDLVELDAETLAALRGEVARIDGAPSIPRNATDQIAGAIKRNWRERQAAQQALREAMQLWGGYQLHLGYNERESQKLFYFKFGVDVMSAQALNKADAEALLTKVSNFLTAANVVKA